MRKWGIVISAFYALILLGLIVPAVILFSGRDFDSWAKFFSSVRETYQDWFFWVPAGAILLSQAFPLFLSVDTSQKRLKPQTHILVSVTLGAILTALLSSAVIWSLGFTIRGDNFWEKFFDRATNLVLFWGALWVLWAILFWFYFRNSSAVVTRLISWLLKGSVLELLIVVPCHIIVRRRHDCSAPSPPALASPPASPSCSSHLALFLYKKRLDSYSR